MGFWDMMDTMMCHRDHGAPQWTKGTSGTIGYQERPQTMRVHEEQGVHKVDHRRL